MARQAAQLPEDPQQHQVKPSLFALKQSAPLKPEEAMNSRQGQTRRRTPFRVAAGALQRSGFRWLDLSHESASGDIALGAGAAGDGFVWEWIAQKDYTVGFASALKSPQSTGDCTIWGSRGGPASQLGVPARGVVGWMAAGEILGLHFWVEVNSANDGCPLIPPLTRPLHRLA